jgi:exosortase
MAESAQPPPSAPPTFGEEMARLGHWCRANPVPAALLTILLGGLVYFFGIQKLFNRGALTTWVWAFRAWNSENDLEHGVGILPAAIIVAWLHREDFRRAIKAPSWLGVPVILLGVLLFVSAAWVQQPRIAIVAFPVLVFGGVLFLWGWQMARLATFPCLFLLFMVPIGFLLSRTVPLQLAVASIVTTLSNLIGIGVSRDGVNLLANDGSFQCQVAGGCSGVRSLMAMALLSSLYGHFTLRATWQRVLIFCMALPFAVVGNIGRVFSIVVVSKLFGSDIGTGPWHDISGFIVTIPIAVGAMIGLANLLTRDWSKTKAEWLKPETPVKPVASGEKTGSNPISYDY